MTQGDNRRHPAAAAVDGPSPAPRTASDAGPRNRLTPRWRKTLLSIHLISSLGLLGADWAVLALAVVGWLGADPVTVYPAAYLLGTVLILPLALAALVTGTLQGLLTRWGLFRHWWVVISLVLTVAGTVLAIFVLVPSLDAAATAAAASQIPPDRLGLVKDSSGATGVLIVITVLSVFKPLGRLRRDNTRPSTSMST